jgi:hypothetical protein
MNHKNPIAGKDHTRSRQPPTSATVAAVQGRIDQPSRKSKYHSPDR